MALAKQERDMAARGEGCLGKAADDEPVFVLRARDLMAPIAIRFWADLVAAAELDAFLNVGGPINQDRISKISEAKALSKRMLEWQRQHGSKIPD